MEIKLSDKYKIESDALNVTIKQYVGLDKDNKETWKPIKYFNTFKCATTSFAELKIRLCKNVKEIIAIEDEIKGVIEKACDEFPWDDYNKLENEYKSLKRDYDILITNKNNKKSNDENEETIDDFNKSEY